VIALLAVLTLASIGIGLVLGRVFSAGVLFLATPIFWFVCAGALAAAGWSSWRIVSCSVALAAILQVAYLGAAWLQLDVRFIPPRFNIQRKPPRIGKIER
jgi:hypothetical protein